MSRSTTSSQSSRGCWRSWGFRAAARGASATLFAETHRDGVASHGLNRFPRFVRQIKAGVVRPDAEPVCAARFGPWEQWDGQLGPGNLNATAATDRAIALAKEHGLGLVALRNTNHWMRGGTYGWQAAAPAWRSSGGPTRRPTCRRGARSPRSSATRRSSSPSRAATQPVVLDVAMSQFSYGKMETLQLRGEQLPMPGGYDEAGHLTTDPGAILKTMRPLPTGYWKGAGLSLVFDMLGAVLSGGQTAHQIGRQPDEFGLSQVFLTFDVSRAGGADAVSRVVSAVIDDLHTAVPAADGSAARYPGSRC